ncbi:hypothetical protein [Chryseolinea sp. H1M3-3]|uniref:hypothetical protein n=1 Tax=Chryseolinea sp. H1M3-3 TaxID=3034144 RepID=UPI0023ED3FB3|nr:hypothetical protein [Chryseolinea sp. H1M3-3]
MKFLLTVFFFSCGIAVSGQNIFNSPYSVYGLGIMNSRLSTLNRGMGGTGIAVRDGYNLNYVNPASYGSIVSPVSSIFEMGFYIEHSSYNTNELSESKTNGSLTNMNYWFKFSPKWSSTVGLSPFSSVSYKINSTRTLGSVQNIDYTYEGNGNISQVYWGNAFSILKNLSFGLNISYLFGTVSKTESIDILSQASSLVFENKINTNKINLDAGMQYVIPFKKNRSLVVGIVGDNGIDFKASQKNYLYDGSADTLATSTGKSLKYKLPASVGIGLALHSTRSIIASDLKFESWGSLDFHEVDVEAHDTWKFSAGYLYRGNPDATHYLGAVSLRAGVHLQNYHLQIKENSFSWWGFTAGASMPMFDNRSSINITYSFDQLGTLTNGLILQRSHQFMVDVVIRDLWGGKRKFD